MINIYYAYLDESREWFTDTDAGPSPDWHDAHEFFKLSEAEAVAEREGGVVWSAL